MKISTHSCFVAIAIVLALAMPRTGAEDSEIKTHTETVEALLERKTLVPAGQRALIDQRKQIIHSLIELSQRDVKQAQSDEERLNMLLTKERAIELLGEYRAVEASDVLVKQIELYSLSGGKYLHFGAPPLDGYIAAESLVKIGSPALSAIHARLTEPVSEKEIRLFVLVINSIDGKERGLIRLEQWLEFDRQRRFDAKERNIARIIQYWKSTSPSKLRWPATGTAKPDEKPTKTNSRE